MPPDITRHVSEEAERIAREVPASGAPNPWRNPIESRETVDKLCIVWVGKYT